MTVAAIYGLPAAPTPPSPPTTAGGTPAMATPASPTVQTAPSRNRPGLLQHPYLVLALILVGAYLMARIAERGISLGLRVDDRR